MSNEINPANISQPDEWEELRARAWPVIKSFPSIAAASRDADIAEATFHAFMNRKYKGRNDNVAAALARWLLAVEERSLTRLVIPQRPSFVATPTSASIKTLLQFAQAMPDMTAIISAPGLGKTETFEDYAANTPNVWLATMEPTTGGVNTMLREICGSMDIQEKSSPELSRAIGNKVRGLRGLLIIDEAQHLSSAALEQVRSLHDRTKMGIALGGNRTIYARLYGEGKEAHAQLFSRVGMKMKQFKPQAGDVSMLLDAWKIAGLGERKFLTAVANKSGALRNMTKCITAASMYAAGAGQALSLEHLRVAWDQLDVNLAADAA